MRRSSRITENAERAAKEREFLLRVEQCSEEDLMIIDAGEKGRGVASSKDFKAGEYVTCYRGELVSHREALRRYSD